MRRRVILIGVVATVAIAAGCGAEEGTATPSPVVLTTASPTASASPSLAGSPSPGAAEASPAATLLSGSPAPRESRTVSCEREPNFCSRGVSMRVSDGNLTSAPQESVSSGGSSTLKITMTSKAIAPSNDEAVLGRDVNKIHVDVTVENDTDRTYVFAKRDVSLRVERNGSRYEELSTTGEGFDMTPGSKMFAKFDVPISDDGNFRWAARTWFYPKP